MAPHAERLMPSPNHLRISVRAIYIGKDMLGIQAIASTSSAWRSDDAESKAQIDLLVDRADGVIKACEMKYFQPSLSIDKTLDVELRERIEAFRSGTGTAKAIRLTMVCPYGVRRNKYWGIVSNEITFEDLFRRAFALPVVRI